MYQFKIRCSQIGQIMGKTKNLTQGNKTYCKKWLLGKIYNDRQEMITSKYMTKGNECEDEGIVMISHQLGLNLTKNKEYKENEFLTGTCDIDTGKTIIDNKCSWSCFTFTLLESEAPKGDYIDQLQGYMELWGRDEAKLCYTLCNTPDKLIKKEARYKFNDEGGDYDQILDKLRAYHDYSEYPMSLRYKEFNIKKDEERISAIKERVQLCQEYINQLCKENQIGEF